MLVVEGGITDGGCDVRLTSTMEMAYPDGALAVKGARVVVTSLDDGHSSTLVYRKYGHYQSSFKGEPGKTYRLDIWNGDQHFTAQSTMPHPGHQFVPLPVAGNGGHAHRDGRSPFSRYA